MIDDKPIYLRPLKEVLERTGRFEVYLESSPLLAIARARVLKPDIVTLDIVMPFYNGGDVMLMLQEDSTLRSTPIIILSSLVNANETGDGGYLISDGQVMMSKPPMPADLLSCIDRSIAGEIS